MKPPVIGITIDSNDSDDRYESPMSYAAAIEKAGGLPLLLPYLVDLALIPHYVELLDGILFSGGNDMNPIRYGEEWHPKVARMDKRREQFEFALIAEVEKRRLPALGVCFGSQLMNVYRGGSLIQFLPEQKPDALEHRRLKDQPPGRHPIKLDTTSQLGRAIGKPDVSVNTYHKQAVNQLGRGLRIIATAPDGVIEAFEDPTLPLFAAVQWHPERLLDEPEHLAPFKLLVEKSASTRLYYLSCYNLPVAHRSEDWFAQAQRDLEQAAASRRDERHEWACFAAHQAAEKALKALHLSQSQEAWGHVVARLLADLPTGLQAPPELIERARVLDTYYIPTRYPNSHPQGPPFEHYGPLQSQEAIDHASQILQFVRDALARRG